MEAETKVQEVGSLVATLPAPEEESTQKSAAKTPLEFYAEITRRDDVRSILEELADA